MSTDVPWRLREVSYEGAAQDYLRSLTLEHFMEATAQATQRAITLASLALVRARRPEVHVFNELLVQYPLRGQRKIGQIVPDNFVVLTEQPIHANLSYNVPLEPAPPFWVLEYVSKNSRRKDYEKSFAKYERELKVPYYLLFYPVIQELTLYRHNKRKYVTVKPNGHGRHPIRELDLELALLDDWVRYWYQGELLPLPDELQQNLDRARQERDEAQQQRDEAQQQRDEAQRQRDEAQQQVGDLQQRLEAAERELTRLRARPGQSQSS